MSYKRKGCGPNALGSALKMVEPVKEKSKIASRGVKKKVTNKMVDDQHNVAMESSFNAANDMAKYAATGVGPSGFPISKNKVDAYKSASNVLKTFPAKPSYRDVGTTIPSGPAPFENDAMAPKKKATKGVKKTRR